MESANKNSSNLTKFSTHLKQVMQFVYFYIQVDDEKLQIILKEQVHRSYIKNIKNRAPKSAAQISATPINICNLSTSKMGKTWQFIFATVDTLKQTLFL
jgi:predicted secreted protein